MARRLRVHTYTHIYFQITFKFFILVLNRYGEVRINLFSNEWTADIYANSYSKTKEWNLNGELFHPLNTITSTNLF